MLTKKLIVLVAICQYCFMMPLAAEAPKPLGGSLPTGLMKSTPTGASSLSEKSSENGASSDIPAVIEITRGQVKATPVAIPLFLGDSEYASKITEVIGNDLTMCGRFDVLNKQSFIQDAVSVHENVRFSDWRVINDQILIIGKVDHSGSKLTVQFKIYDVVNGMLLKGFSLSTDEKKWRKLAHMISDAVYERVTGDAGFFDSQVVFIDEQGSGKNKKKRLCMMDIDGHNVVYLTNGSNLVLTPRFSPSTHHIAYLGFRKNSAAVYLMDVREREAKILGTFEGMTFAPRFSPDGSKVVMSLTKGASTALYTYNISTKETRQLTPHTLIDTSPCYSPDGAYIVFTSDRNNNGSAEKLFTMKSDGSDVKQISNGPGNHSQPVWSPRGDLIAFSKRGGGTYNLCVINTDGTEERIIDQGYLIEGAAWSPNGRYIIYTKETSYGKSQLCCADLTGHVKMPIKTPHNASDPAWSPLLSNISVKDKPAPAA